MEFSLEYSVRDFITTALVSIIVTLIMKGGE